MGVVLSWLSANWFALLQTVGIVGSLLLVVVQIRASTRQREMESLVEIYDINRQLLSLGFSHPRLFAILNDSKDADSTWERYYLQMWFNQYSLAHLYLLRSVFGDDLRVCLARDLADFMTMENTQRHWQRFGMFFPASFQKYVNEILKKIEPPPVTAAQVKPK